MYGTIMPVMIGDRIRKLRQAKKMTQEALARAASLGLSHLARIEQGVIADPSWSTVRAIAQALGAAVTDLEDDDDADEKQAPGRPKKKK
jgi:XRE family transcriptional regulator, master regulator for biofilm formation